MPVGALQELTVATIAAAIASGALVGFFLASFGGGGSVLAAPLLLYAVGVRDPHMAIGTSAAAVAATASVSLVAHWRGGRVKWPCAMMFAASGLVGALIGSSLAKATDGRWLLLAFAGAMATIGLALLLRRNAEGGNTSARLTRGVAMRLAPIGGGVGLASGFFGIGGGCLIVPGLMAGSGMSMANATASSLVSVAMFGAATSANYAVSGWVDWRLVSLVLLGGAAGGFVGLAAARRLATRSALARQLFASMVIAVAAYVAWRALAALTGGA